MFVCVRVCAYQVYAHTYTRQAQRHQGTMQAVPPCPRQKRPFMLQVTKFQDTQKRMQNCPRADRVCARQSVVSTRYEAPGPEG